MVCRTVREHLMLGCAAQLYLRHPSPPITHSRIHPHLLARHGTLAFCSFLLVIVVSRLIGTYNQFRLYPHNQISQHPYPSKLRFCFFAQFFFCKSTHSSRTCQMAPKYPPSSLSYFPPLPSPSSRCRAGWAMLPHTRHDLYTQLAPSFLCPGQKNIRSLCFDHPVPGTNLYLYSSVTYLLLKFLFLSHDQSCSPSSL